MVCRVTPDGKQVLFDELNWTKEDVRAINKVMKQESLVIAGQHTAVNTFPGLVHTARHTTKVIHTRSR